MQNPIATVAEWFDRQALEVKQDFGVLVGYVVMPSDSPSGDPAGWFREWLTPTGNLRVDASKAILLRSAVELVLASRFTGEGWRRFEEMAQGLRARLIREGKDTEFVDKPLRQAPLREASWLRVGQEWRDLASEHLNDEVLNELLFPIPRSR